MGHQSAATAESSKQAIHSLITTINYTSGAIGTRIGHTVIEKAEQNLLVTLLLSLTQLVMTTWQKDDLMGVWDYLIGSIAALDFIRRADKDLVAYPGRSDNKKPLHREPSPAFHFHSAKQGQQTWAPGCFTITTELLRR